MTISDNRRDAPLFRPKVTRRYRAIVTALENKSVPRGYVIIPGRQRSIKDGSDRAYVEVRRGEQSRRFYFKHTPKAQEVIDIVGLMIEVLKYEPHYRNRLEK